MYSEYENNETIKLPSWAIYLIAGAFGVVVIVIAVFLVEFHVLDLNTTNNDVNPKGDTDYVIILI